MYLQEYEFSKDLRKDISFLDFVTDITKIINGFIFTRVLAKLESTGQSDSITTTTLFTPSVQGTFRVSVYHICTTAGSGGTLDTTIGWTDTVGAKTNNPASQINLNGLGNAASGQCFILSTASPITFSTTVTGASGNPKYAVYITVEQIA